MGDKAFCLRALSLSESPDSMACSMPYGSIECRYVGSRDGGTLVWPATAEIFAMINATLQSKDTAPDFFMRDQLLGSCLLWRTPQSVTAGRAVATENIEIFMSR